MTSQTPGTRHLVLRTISFTICFAAWGLISAFAPMFRQRFHLTAPQAALLVAVPVLLGSLARVPMGILTDRFGGRLVFTALMAFVVLPALASSGIGYGKDRGRFFNYRTNLRRRMPTALRNPEPNNNMLHGSGTRGV